jgi:hypothetical protein
MRRITFDRLLGWVGCSLGVLLLVVATLLLWASAYIHNNVQNQLSAQQITFPAAAAFAHPTATGEITPSMIPSVSQYAGQQLLTGQQAEAYADHFIAVHLQNMTGGKTYAQLSAQAQAQPGNTALANEVSTVFKGTTLRSMLLTAYSWWKVSQITYIVSLAAYGLGAVAFAAGLAGFGRVLRDRKNPGARLGAHAPAIEQISPAGHEAGTTA